MKIDIIDKAKYKIITYKWVTRILAADILRYVEIVSLDVDI